MVFERSMLGIACDHSDAVGWFQKFVLLGERPQCAEKAEQIKMLRSKIKAILRSLEARFSGSLSDAPTPRQACQSVSVAKSATASSKVSDPLQILVPARRICLSGASSRPTSER